MSYGSRFLISLGVGFLVLGWPGYEMNLLDRELGELCTYIGAISTSLGLSWYLLKKVK